MSSAARELCACLLFALAAACAARTQPTPAAPLPLPAVHLAAHEEPRTFGLLIQSAWDAPRDMKVRREEWDATAALFERMGAGERRWWIAAGPERTSEPRLHIDKLLPPDASWLLEGTGLERLAANVMFWSGKGPNGNPIVPFTRAGLSTFLGAAEQGLRPGDTLVLASNGPGDAGSRDPRRHGLPLWGGGGLFTVEELARSIDRLPAGVRVILRLSHCEAGAFARLPALVKAPGLVCGTVAAREPAGGECASEGAQLGLVGHARAIDAGLGAGLALGEAHERALAADDLDEVPVLTSQSYAWERLVMAARPARRDSDGFAAGWLARAWDDPNLTRERLALSAVVARFGLPEPHTLADVDEASHRLRDLWDAAVSLDHAWSLALGQLNRAQLQRLDEQRQLPTHDREKLEALPLAERQAALHETVVALTTQLRGEGPRWQRLTSLIERRRAARAAIGRILARLAAVERMRRLLRAMAARQYLAGAGTDQERAVEASLRACEDWRPITQTTALTPPAPLGPLVDDWQTARALAPARLGLALEPPSWLDRRWRHLPPGALVITSARPDQPAWTAGLRPDDVVTGLDGAPFTDPGELMAWVHLGPAGAPLPVALRRGRERKVVTLVPERDDTSLAVVEATGLGGKAPRASGVDCGDPGGMVPEEHQPVVFFFWRTDCPRCLEALEPMMLASLRLGAVPVAVTAEPAEAVHRFLDARHMTFPFPMLCEASPTVSAYHAGAPTFVLVGADLRIRARSDGFEPGQPIFDEQ
jgi:hypothetical protein